MTDWAIIILLWITLGGGVIIGFALSIAMHHRLSALEIEDQLQSQLRSFARASEFDKHAWNRR